MKKLFYFLLAMTCMGQSYTLRNPVILASRQGVVVTNVVAGTNYFLLLETGDNILLETGDRFLLENSSAPPTGTNSFLMESGGQLLLETGDQLLLE